MAQLVGMYMKSPLKHVVVDTNILGDFLHPSSTKATARANRSQEILNSAVLGNWPLVKIYTPAICIAEAIGIIDKYRFCTWGRELTRDSSLRLSKRQHTAARQVLTKAVATRKIEQLEHEPNHILLAGLVSPINANYQIRRSSNRIRPPMGAADCVIAGMAIHLVSRMGRDSVLLVTGDQRMADVIRKARSIRQNTAESLGLTELARLAGLHWSKDLYPDSINLHRASEDDLRKAFGGWPLPSGVVVEKTRSQLTQNEKSQLLDCWLEVATEYNFTNVDNLPYSEYLEDIRVRFAVRSKVFMLCDEVFRFLLQQRKSTKLPYPER